MSINISPRSVLALVLLMLLSAMALPALAQSPRGGGKDQGPRPVLLAMPRTEALAERAWVTGTAEANASVEIRPEVTGRLTEILFAEGSEVKAGEVLVRIDARAAAARRDRVRAQLDNVEQQLERARALKEGRSVAAARVDELAAEADAARAALREAEVDVDLHTIRMPFDGIVGLRRVSVGGQVTPATVITTADDTHTLFVVFRVPDLWLARIRPGLPVSLQPPAREAPLLTGEVVALDSRVDSASRTIGVKARIDKPRGLIKPGALVRVDVPLEESDHALVIPEQAILTSGAENAVFIVSDGKAKRVVVKLGLRQRGMVEVTEGLNIGTPVIAAGADRLRDGALVEPAGTIDGWGDAPKLRE